MNIHVGVRVRPLLENEISSSKMEVKTDSGKITIIKEGVKNDLTPISQKKQYPFSSVFGENIDNNDLFLKFYQPIIEKSFQKKNSLCFFNFGYTGSGKTYTMLRPDGIINSLFQWMKRKNNSKIAFSSYEIYQNQVYDLLVNPKNNITEFSHKQHRSALPCLENRNRHFKISGATEITVHSSTDLKHILDKVVKNRRCGISSCNKESSRSHGIFQFSWHGINISIIDLAGSEKAKTSRYQSSDPVEMQQNASINQSLLALKECIRCMSQKKSHIPFRRSKLTSVLRNFFISQSQIIFLANISPDPKCYSPTINILDYAWMMENLGITQKGLISVPKITVSTSPINHKRRLSFQENRNKNNNHHNLYNHNHNYNHNNHKINNIAVYNPPRSAPNSPLDLLNKKNINSNEKNSLPVMDIRSARNSLNKPLKGLRAIVQKELMKENRQVKREINQQLPILSQYRYLNYKIQQQENNLVSNHSPDSPTFKKNIKQVIYSKINILDTVVDHLKNKNIIKETEVI